VNEEGGYLMLSECERIAFELRTDKERITKVIKSDLFVTDGEKFWSESILKRLNKRHEKSEKAKKSAEKRWKDANAMRTHSERNAIKESKGKDIKGKDIEIIGNGDKYFLVIPNAIGSKKYRIQGTDGLNKFMELHQSILDHPDQHLKFMREVNGDVFNDLMHVRNRFKKFIEKQYA